MFGFVTADYGSLSESDKAIYKSYYCGLCRELNRSYGLTGRLTLNYDMTFLALFLSGYFEPVDTISSFKCPRHPFKKQAAVKNGFIEYSADMNILLTYHKLTDNINDDGSKTALAFRNKLEPAYTLASKKHKNKNEAVIGYLGELAETERRDEHNPDIGAACFGNIMGVLFDINGDNADLYEFGFRLGKVIYIMDACVDFKKDIKNCRYNPMVEIPCKNFQQILTILLAECTRVYDKIEPMNNKSITDNILYSGIWQKFREMNK